MAYAGLILEIFTYSSNLELPFKDLVLVRSRFKHLAHPAPFSIWLEGRMLSNSNNVKPRNSTLVHDKDGQAHLDLSVQPSREPKEHGIPQHDIAERCSILVI